MRARSTGTRPRACPRRTARDEFIVREYIAEEAPRVVLLWDRRPAMSLFPRPLPWLAKPEAVRVAADLVSEATLAARGFLGYLDLDDEKATWVAPRSEHELPDAARQRSLSRIRGQSRARVRLPRAAAPTASRRNVHLRLLRFPRTVSDDTWVFTLERGWDVVPVIVQDPVWERSFPEVGGVVVPLHDRSTGRFVSVRLTDREAIRRREENEARSEDLLLRLRALDLGPVVVSTTDREQIFQAFLEWADERIISRGRWW